MIKRALVRYPTYAPTEINNFIQLLLEKNGNQRLENALGTKKSPPEKTEKIEKTENLGADPGSDSGINSVIIPGLHCEKPKEINYDFLRGHDFFKLGCRYFFSSYFFVQFFVSYFLFSHLIFLLFRSYFFFFSFDSCFILSFCK